MINPNSIRNIIIIRSHWTDSITKKLIGQKGIYKKSFVNGICAVQIGKTIINFHESEISEDFKN